MLTFDFSNIEQHHFVNNEFKYKASTIANDGEGLGDIEGLILGLIDADIEAEGEIDRLIDADKLRLSEAEGLILGLKDKLIDELIEAEGETLGEIDSDIDR